MEISFESVVERDIDMLIIRIFSVGNNPLIELFAKCAGLKDMDYEIESIAHSVMTSDGESDIEVIFSRGDSKIAFLIEDKIDAIAQPQQADRYRIRGDKAVEDGKYDEYYVFIIAPQKYLDGDSEAAKYQNRISYEEIRGALDSPYDVALIDKALDESKHGYVPVEDRNVTAFWDMLYDYIDENYPDTFNVHGKKGESRGTKARWISISSGHGATIQIKCDRGYVDLEIPSYADRFAEFSKANQELLDRKRLYVRMASKSLAIRKYIDVIDFTGDFDEQAELVADALHKAKELQDLIKDLKF